jgi:hypothetical protein
MLKCSANQKVSKIDLREFVKKTISQIRDGLENCYLQKRFVPYSNDKYATECASVDVAFNLNARVCKTEDGACNISIVNDADACSKDSFNRISFVVPLVFDSSCGVEVKAKPKS